MKPTRIVFDTNVYLAATKAGSYASQHLKQTQPNGAYQLFVSPEIIIEVREKLEAKFKYSGKESSGFIDMILVYANLVNPKRKIHNILADMDDHKILECAVEAKADIIISSDRGLLKLKQFEDIKIYHPAMLKFWYPQ